MKFEKGCEILWQDRKRHFGLPISFTRYYIVKKEGEWVKLFIHRGFLSALIDEVNLYRCYDLSLHISLADKIFKTGTVHVAANDDSTPEIYIRNVTNPYKVRDLMSGLIEEERRKKKVGITEFQT